ncbi:MAG: hypothetical protein IPG06_25090 [Haliea sp.]|nr:hypothetical protein [Haliea sp.]
MDVEQVDLFDPRVTLEPPWGCTLATDNLPRDIFLRKQANTLIFIPYGKYLLILAASALLNFTVRSFLDKLWLTIRCNTVQSDPLRISFNEAGAYSPETEELTLETISEAG